MSVVMKKALFAFVGLSMCLAGCSTQSNTGVLTGAAMGAGSEEGASNRDARRDTKGTAGGLIGDALDESDSTALLRESPHTLRKVNRGDQLNFDDINYMLRAGIQEQVIIGQIECTDSHFYLTTADIIALRNSGVSQNLIDLMIRSAS